jgi:hypothetical protein
MKFPNGTLNIGTRSARGMTPAEAFYILAMVVIAAAWYFADFGVSTSLDILVIGLTIALIVAMEFRNLAHVMFMVGFLTFVLMPVVSIYDLIYVSSDLVLALSFSTVLFLWMTQGSSLPLFGLSARRNAIYKLSAIAAFALVLVAVGVNGLMITPLVLVSFFYLVQGQKFTAGIMMLCIVFLYIAIFGLFFWSGFGRLILASWLMAALWIFWCRYSIPFGKLIVFAPILAGEYVLQAFGSTRRAFSMRDNFLNDTIGSDLSPFLLANSFADTERFIDMPGMFGQYILYFFQWVPRAVWADKPLGFGFEYTVQNYGPGMIAAGHSVAALHIGEHLYYLNSLGYISFVFSIVLVAASYKFLMRLDSRIPFLALIFAMYIPTFVWGGMAALMSRVWVGILFVIFVYAFLRLLSVFTKPTRAFRSSRT